MADRLHLVTGAHSPRGTRIVEVRDLDMNDGGTVRIYDLMLILPNGDWTEPSGGDAAAAMGWLAGDE